MIAWTRIDFGPNVKLHAVSTELREALLVDMAARGHTPTATFSYIDGLTAVVPDANARVDAFIRSARGTDDPAPDWTN